MLVNQHPFHVSILIGLISNPGLVNILKTEKYKQNNNVLVIICFLK